MRWFVVGGALALLGCQPVPPEPVEVAEGSPAPADETRLIRFEASLSRTDRGLVGRGALQFARRDSPASLFIHAKARCPGTDVIEVDLARVQAVDEFDLHLFGPDASVSPRGPCEVELRLVDSSGAAQRPLGIYCVDSKGATRGVCPHEVAPIFGRTFEREVFVERIRPSFDYGISVDFAAIPATDVVDLMVSALATCEDGGREYSDEQTVSVSDGVFVAGATEANAGRLHFFAGRVWKGTDFEQTRCQLSFETFGWRRTATPVEVCVDHGTVRQGRCDGFSHGVHVPSKRVLANPEFIVREEKHFFGESDYSVLFVADVIRGEEMGEQLDARAVCDVDGTPQEDPMPLWFEPWAPVGLRGRGYLSAMRGFEHPPTGCKVDLFSDDGTELSARYCWDGHAAAECS